jgi:hypothetical protein
MNAQWFGIWQQMPPSLKRALAHRERGSEIAEKAA